MHTPAAAARAIRFGPFQVDPRTRELRKGGTRIRVPDQSVRILLALLDRAGDVVTRDELAAVLWPGETGVDIEHGLNSAVRRLRDALGDSADNPAYVETVPRVGYRFVGTVDGPRALAPEAAVVEAVHDLPAEGTQSASTEPQRQSMPAPTGTTPRTLRWLAAAASVLLTAIAIYAALRKQVDSGPTPPLATPIPLTFDGGLQTDPSFSPDGQHIAYASDSGGNFDLWIRGVSGGAPVRITHDPAADYQPDWSPDGSQLVFRSERAGGGLFVVPAAGGAARQISRIGFRPRWSPDGRRILYAGVVVTHLSLNLQAIDPDGAAPHRWPGRSSGAFGWQPRSSTVLTLASLSGPFDPELWSWNVGDPSATRWTVEDDVNRGFRTERLVVVGGEQLLVPADLSALYFIGASRGTRALWRVDIDAAARRVAAGPYRLTTLPQPSNARLSPDGRRVVFDGAPRNAQIWSYPLDTRQRSDADAVAMTSDAAHADSPALSRDGGVFAFVLTRPGSPERSELMARLPGQASDRTLRVIEEPYEISNRHRARNRRRSDGVDLRDPGPRTARQTRLVGRWRDAVLHVGRQRGDERVGRPVRSGSELRSPMPRVTTGCRS